MVVCYRCSGNVFWSGVVISDSVDAGGFIDLLCFVVVWCSLSFSCRFTCLSYRSGVVVYVWVLCLWCGSCDLFGVVLWGCVCAGLLLLSFVFDLLCMVGYVGFMFILCLGLHWFWLRWGGVWYGVVGAV